MPVCSWIIGKLNIDLISSVDESSHNFMYVILRLKDYVNVVICSAVLMFLFGKQMLRLIQVKLKLFLVCIKFCKLAGFPYRKLAVSVPYNNR